MSSGTKLLQDFARDQDVYETPDPPDGSTNFDDDTKSASVHKLDANMQSSFEKFKDKAIDGKDIDFSDRVSRPVQSGFRAEPTDYELIATSREPETLLQRFHRLKQEVAELETEVQALQSSDTLENVSPVDLLQDVQLIQTQLHSIQLDRVLGGRLATTDPEQPQGTLLLRDVQSQLQALKAAGKTAGASGVEAGGQTAVYELYTRTEAAKFTHLSKLEEVERRIATLESVVGNDTMALSTVTGGMDSEQSDLSSAVLSLQAKVALLDTAHVNTMGTQLQGLLSVLEQVQKQAPPSNETQTKVTEALNSIGRVVSVAPLLPDIVARLHALGELHERAAQFAGSVASMSDGQEQLSSQVKELTQLLETVQVSLQSNLSTLHSQFTTLEGRITALQGKK